ncbi:MAG TPA: helix-turn-helix domain-containing protein [Chloroflexota bacterium]|nr:helix-turn-helix domain-containing protein [Chloroflexota bacterium]
MGEAFLTAAEVARRLDCSVSLVQKWRRLGWLPATRLGPPASPVYGYLLSDVEHFAATRWNRRRGRPPGTSLTETTGNTPGASPQPTPAKPAPFAKVVVHSIPPIFETARAATNPSGPGDSSAGPRRTVPTAPPRVPRTTEARPPRPLGASGTVGTPAGRRVEDMPARSGRPLVLWDADPRHVTAMVLARFPAAEFDTALATASAWSRRYPTVALGEAPAAGAPANVLALWQNGNRVGSSE